MRAVFVPWNASRRAKNDVRGVQVGIARSMEVPIERRAVTEVLTAVSNVRQSVAQ